MLWILQFAALVVSSASPQQKDTARPLTMRVDEDGSATVVNLIGISDYACSVSYDLEVSQGGNRSIQRGVARLHPGLTTTVATVRLAPHPLYARLAVKPCGLKEYEETFGRPGR